MTLIELLVVMGIIGLVVGISLPALTTYTRQVRLKTTIRQVIGLLSFTRSLAISSHTDHAVVLDPERAELRVVNVASGETLEQAVHLPTSVNVSVHIGGEPSTETQIVFRATGSLIGRTTSLIVADEHTHHTITVTGATGAVTLED